MLSLHAFVVRLRKKKAAMASAYPGPVSAVQVLDSIASFNVFALHFGVNGFEFLVFVLIGIIYLFLGSGWLLLCGTVLSSSSAATRSRSSVLL